MIHRYLDLFLLYLIIIFFSNINIFHQIIYDHTSQSYHTSTLIIE